MEGTYQNKGLVRSTFAGISKGTVKMCHANYYLVNSVAFEKVALLIKIVIFFLHLMTLSEN